MKNTPAIETERLILRRFEMNDVQALYSILSDKEVNTFLPMFPLANLEEARKFLQVHYLDSYERNSGFHYAVCLKSENIPIGYLNVSEDESHDFGYGLRKEYWRQGIMTEAGKAVLVQLRLSGMPYVTATHDVNNPQSGNVMKRLGMAYRYSYEEQWQPKNILVTFRMYQLNLDGQDDRLFKKYWDQSSVHYIEKDV